jgi:hypothetical protein
MNAAKQGIAEVDIETEIAAYRRVLRSLMTE